MKLVPNEESESNSENYTVRLTYEEFKLLRRVLAIEARKVASIEPTEPKKDIQPYHDKERTFFGQERRTKERRSPVVSRRTGERCTPCGRRTLVSRRKS